MLRIVVWRGGSELGASDHASDLVRIGRHPDNDIHIDDEEALSDHHVEIWAFNGVCHIRSPDQHKLLVADRLIEGRGHVADREALIIGDLRFGIWIDPPEEDRLERLKRTWRTGRIQLKGSDLLELPERGADQRLLLRARRVLVQRGATEDELAQLRAGGPELAQAILDDAAARGQLPTSRSLRKPEAVRGDSPRAVESTDPYRPLKLIVLGLTGLVGLGVMLFLMRELMLSFTS